MTQISIKWTPSGSAIVQPKNMPAVEIPKQEAADMHDCAASLYDAYHRRLAVAYECEQRIAGSSAWNLALIKTQAYTVAIQEHLKQAAQGGFINFKLLGWG